MVLMFLAAFVIMSAAISRIMQTRAQSTRYYDFQARALDVAQAGVAHALQMLSDTPSWSTGFNNMSFGTGTYTVTVDSSQFPTSIKSVGTIPAAGPVKHDVSRTVTVRVYFGQVCVSLGKDVTIKGTSTCVGDVFSDRDIILSDGTVKGNALAVRNINLTAPWTITGTKSSVNYPPAPSGAYLKKASKKSLHSTYKTQAQAGGTSVGDYTINGTTVTLGPLYIKSGKLTIKSGAVVTLAGTVYVDDDISIDQSQLKGAYTLYTKDKMTITKSTVGAGNSGPLLISENDFTVDQSTLTPAVVYNFTKSTFTKTTMTGSAAANNLIVDQTSTITWAGIKYLDIDIGTIVSADWTMK